MANSAVVGILRAQLSANAAEFEGGIKKAAAAVTAFGSAAGKVGTESLRVGNAVNGLVRGLGGDRLLQTANNLTAAVQRLGGVTKLTVAEQARLNTTLTKAIEKYAALGKAAPQAMRDLEKATRKTEAATGGLSTTMVAFGAAVGTFLGHVAYDAVRRLASGIVDLASHGIALAPVVASFERLTASIGESSNAMLTATRGATKGLIGDLDIMAAANKAILLGLPVTAAEMGLLGAAAVTLGKAMKQDAATSLNDLITALGRSSPLILDNLGLTVKVGEANETYARQVGKSASQLTDAEQKLAFYNAAMLVAKQRAEDLGGVQLALADQVGRVRVSVRNFTDALGVAVAQSPVLNSAFGGIADSLNGAFGGNQVALVQNLIGVVNRLAIGVVDAAQLGLKAAGFMRQGWGALQLLFTGTVSVITSVGLAFANLVAGAANAAAGLPGIGSAFEGVARKATDFATRLRGIQQSFHDQATEALDATRGHGAFQQSLDRASTALTSMRVRMVEAAGQQVASGDIAAAYTRRVDDITDATTKSAGAATQWAKTLSDVRNAQGMADFDALAAAEQAASLGRSVDLLSAQTRPHVVPAPVFGDASDMLTPAAELAAVRANEVAEAFALMGQSTRTELQHTADEAQRAFQVMQRSGLATADALQAGWERSEAARRAASDESTRAWTANADTLLTGAEQAFQALGTKYKAAAIAGAIITRLGSGDSARRRASAGRRNRDGPWRDQDADDCDAAVEDAGDARYVRRHVLRRRHGRPGAPTRRVRSKRESTASSLTGAKYLTHQHFRD